MVKFIRKTALCLALCLLLGVCAPAGAALPADQVAQPQTAERAADGALALRVLTQDDGTCTATITNADVGSRVVAAAYSRGGKLLEAAAASVTGAATEVVLTTGNADHYKAFCLNSATRAPAAAAASAYPLTACKYAIQVDRTVYRLWMTESALRAAAGAPDETLKGIWGITWYLYGTGNYANFFMAGISENQVVALCAAGSSCYYAGIRIGELSAASTSMVKNGSASAVVECFTDENDSSRLHCVSMYDFSDETEADYSAANLAAESKIDFHLVNAFRNLNGKRALVWSSKTAAAALAHSADMSANNYFSHDSQDGRKFSERLTAAGIAWTSCGENIAAGNSDAVHAHSAWVNSSGHRKNLLGDNYSYMGTGASYSEGSDYKRYYTEDFYS